MNSMAQIVSIGISLIFMSIIFELTRRKKLKEKYALLWIAVGTTIIILAIFKEIVFFIASIMGIKTPINAMLFIGIFFILIINLYYSLEISKLNEQVKKLAQKLALLQHGKSKQD